MTHYPIKIISGGQTGADLGGLVGARRKHIITGGTAPKGYRTEKGPQREALQAFGLTEHTSESYQERTRVNVESSDGTLIFSPVVESSGTQLTIKFCQELHKPFLLIEQFNDATLETARIFLEFNRPEVLNIAGNRESKSPGLTALVASFIERLLAPK